MEQAEIYREIARAREELERLRVEGRFHQTPDDRKMPIFLKACILAERTGKVCTAVMHEVKGCTSRETSTVRVELIQVAAVVVAWLEAL